MFHRAPYEADAAGIKAALEAAKDAKLDGVEWTLPQALASPSDVLCKIAAQSLATTTTRCAIAVTVASTDLETIVHELNEALEASEPLRATCLSVTLPRIKDAPPTAPTPDAPVAFARYQDHLNFAFQLLHRLRFTAERTGVALAIEGGVGGGLLSPVELREIVDEANSRAVGVCIDTERVAAIGSPADWIDTLRHRVHAVRFGGGVTDVAVLGALDRLGYDRTCVVADVDTGPAIREAITRS